MTGNVCSHATLPALPKRPDYETHVLFFLTSAASSIRHRLYSDDIASLIKAFPRDIAPIEKISVLAKLIHKDLEDRKLLLDTSRKLEKIMNEKMSKRRIQTIEHEKGSIKRVHQLHQSSRVAAWLDGW